MLSAQECLVGTWLADNDFFLSFIREFGDEVKSITGEVFVTYGPDGTHETEYSDWEITAESEGITVVIRREGTDTGEYSATPSALTFGDTTMGSTITLSGEGFNMSVEPEPSTHSSLPYTCDSSTLILTTPETDVTMTRR